MGYRVTARNAATASENRIHADDVARRYGFRGGLVPGVTVYAYASHALLGALGSDWVERGEVRIRFPSPCYDGEVLTVTLSPGEKLRTREPTRRTTPEASDPTTW